MSKILRSIFTHGKLVIVSILALTMLFSITAFASEEQTPLPDKYTVVLFGLDSKEKLEDSCMIVTINNKDEKLEALSVLETLPLKPEKPEEKEKTLQQFYVDNGVEKTVERLEKELDIKIDDYLISNMEEFEKMIDNIGGIEVELNEKEAGILGAKFNKIYKADKQKLNGEETLWICKVKNGTVKAEDRAETQRKVVKSILKQINDMNLEDGMKVAADYIEAVQKTSIDQDDIDLVFAMPFDDYELSSELWKENK